MIYQKVLAKVKGKSQKCIVKISREHTFDNTFPKKPLFIGYPLTLNMEPSVLEFTYSYATQVKQFSQQLLLGSHQHNLLNYHTFDRVRHSQTLIATQCNKKVE